MNPYLRKDIGDYITEYWRDIHENKYIDILYRLRQVTKDIRSVLNDEDFNHDYIGYYSGNRTFATIWLILADSDDKGCFSIYGVSISDEEPVRDILPKKAYCNEIWQMFKYHGKFRRFLRYSFDHNHNYKI